MDQVSIIYKRLVALYGNGQIYLPRSLVSDCRLPVCRASTKVDNTNLLKTNKSTIRENRLEAMTIVESMTAMLLIVLSFGIGMMIYMNILSSEQVVVRTRANLLLHQVLEDSKQHQRFLDESLEIEGLLIEKQLREYGQNPDNYLLHLQAFDGRNRAIGELKQVLYLPKTQ